MAAWTTPKPSSPPPWSRSARGSGSCGSTLTGLAASTGISKSTLSGLENGQRRPTLELLLPLANAYRIPLDDLVGAPEVADPRVRLETTAAQRSDRVIPLARHPGGLQAWKIVIPASKNTPEPKAHEGYEWLYVISGRMRLVLAGHDIVLGQAKSRNSTPTSPTGSAAPATSPPRY